MKYQPKTNRKRGMWDMIRSISRKRIKPSDLELLNLTRIQARVNLREMYLRGELKRIRKGVPPNIQPVYSKIMRRFTNDYNPDGKQKRREARERVGNKCIRCGSPSVPGKILTTHHFNGDKSNDAWWNLLPLCQSCHLHIQGKVDPEIPFFLEHSDWLKPYVAGFYAWKYEGRMIERSEAEKRMDELLAYERRA